MLEDLSRWRKYRSGLCDNCQALCCHLPVEVDLSDLVRLEIIQEFDKELGEKHVQKLLRGHPAVASFSQKTKKFTLSQQSTGACSFLDSNKRCQVYEKRPNTCRNHPQIGPRPGFCPHQLKS